MHTWSNAIRCRILPSNHQRFIKGFASAFSLAFALACSGVAGDPAEQPTGTVEPSPSANGSTPPNVAGTYASPTGSLVLTQQGERVSGRYSAVFGSSAHMCDCDLSATWDGTAFVLTDRPAHTTLTPDNDRLRFAGNLNDCCGSGWTGDDLERQDTAAGAPNGATHGCVDGAERCDGTYAGAVAPGNNPPSGAQAMVCHDGNWTIKERCDASTNNGCYEIEPPAGTGVAANCLSATETGGE